MILLKDLSIKYDGLRPEMWFALGVACAIRQDLYKLNCVITSLLDGEHNPGSLHPKGYAVDLRTLDLTVQERQSFITSLRQELEPLGFQVIWEGGPGATAATTGAHVHVEWDPHDGKHFWHFL
jgi:hypothetical protein